MGLGFFIVDETSEDGLGEFTSFGYSTFSALREKWTDDASPGFRVLTSVRLDAEWSEKDVRDVDDYLQSLKNQGKDYAPSLTEIVHAARGSNARMTIG